MARNGSTGVLLAGTKVLHKLHEANVLLEPEAKSKVDMSQKLKQFGTASRK